MVLASMSISGQNWMFVLPTMSKSLFLLYSDNHTILCFCMFLSDMPPLPQNLSAPNTLLQGRSLVTCRRKSFFTVESKFCAFSMLGDVKKDTNKSTNDIYIYVCISICMYIYIYYLYIYILSICMYICWGGSTLAISRPLRKISEGGKIAIYIFDTSPCFQLA